MQLNLGLDTSSTQPPGAHPGLNSADTLLALLDDWQNAGWLRLLDVYFARFLYAEQPQASALLLLAAALASHQMGRGHVCLDLVATLSGADKVLNLPPELRATSGAEAPPVTPAELLGSVTLEDWKAALDPGLVSDGGALAPLVYDDGRLYLYRYWHYEQQVAQGIGARVQSTTTDIEPSKASLRATLDALFGPPPSDGGVDWQRLACALAVRRRFAIITGGLGTGKTTTVLRLLAVLQALHFQRDARAEGEDWQPLRIRLAAPTGKAAARLSESIAARVAALPLESLPGGLGLADAIPTQVVTLHRLLGGRPHVRQRRYHADNPLPLDVLVIDEASMVSLSDMADVMAALPPQARLVLIGDKDQLSSVEAGAVLGELCRRAVDGHYLPSTAQWLAEASGMTLPDKVLDTQGGPLDQAVAMLRTSHRFDEDSGIGRLAQAINDGEVSLARRLLDTPPPDLACLYTDSPLSPAFASLLVDGGEAQAGGRSKAAPARQGYRHYLDVVRQMPPAEGAQPAWDSWAAAVLQAHRACQVLCVVRTGPWGVEGLNVSIARILNEKGLIPARSGWYAGRPVMVTRNNPALRLTNGDIGVALPCPVGEGQPPALRVAFPSAEGVRWFAPNRLDDIETVYALTVHKSQGSEFHHAVLVLPQAPSPVLTRELLYTGITRASDWFTLVNPGGPGLLGLAIKQRVHRSGGLGNLLCRHRGVMG